MTIHEYAKLSRDEKESFLKHTAIFLDHFEENGNTTYVYFLDDFFIEVVLCKEKVIDILPFKRGYKLKKEELHNLEKRNILFNPGLPFKNLSSAKKEAA